MYLVAWLLETELTRMDAEFVSRDTDTLRVPKRTHSSASKLPAV